MLLAILTPLANKSAIFDGSGTWKACTPQVSDSILCVAWLEVIARMGTSGRYLATRRAVLPDEVKAIIAAAPSSRII